MYSPLHHLQTDPLSRLRCGGLWLGLMALLGCQPSAPPAPTAPTTGQLVTEVERVLPGVKDKIAAQQASGWSPVEAGE